MATLDNFACYESPSTPRITPEESSSSSESEIPVFSLPPALISEEIMRNDATKKDLDLKSVMAAREVQPISPQTPLLKHDASANKILVSISEPQYIYLINGDKYLSDHEDYLGDVEDCLSDDENYPSNDMDSTLNDISWLVWMYSVIMLTLIKFLYLLFTEIIA